MLLPGLAGPQSDHPVGDYLRQRPAALDLLVSRSRVDAFDAPHVDAALLRLFNIEGTNCPVAPLGWLADSGTPPSGYVMRADPVHLRADQSCLRLFTSDSFSIRRDEADALVEAFNTFNRETGLQLQAPHPRRWYLHLDEPPDLQTTPPVLAAGEDINAWLPQGADARRWHVLLNEVQMLFHAHAVNEARTASSQPVINSLWLWGGGTLPFPVAAGVDRVLASNHLAQVLAGRAGIGCEDLPPDADDILAACMPGASLIMEPALRWPAVYNDVEQWIDELERMEQRLFRPMLAALRSGRIGSLTLLPCNGRSYRVTRTRLYAFWRTAVRYEDRVTP